MVNAVGVAGVNLQIVKVQIVKLQIVRIQTGKVHYEIANYENVNCGTEQYQIGVRTNTPKPNVPTRACSRALPTNMHHRWQKMVGRHYEAMLTTHNWHTPKQQRKRSIATMQRNQIAPKPSAV